MADELDLALEEKMALEDEETAQEGRRRTAVASQTAH